MRQAAEQLWQLVTVRAELPQHLAALKDYSLLSRGDFYQSFLLEVHPSSDQLSCLLLRLL